MQKLTFFIFGLFLLVFQVYYFFSLKPTTEVTGPIASEHATKELEEQTMTQAYLVESNRDSRDWEVKASRAHKPMGSNEWNLEKVDANFFSGTANYHIVGDTGRVDEIKKSMEINGNVKLTSSNDYIFFTNKLKYDPEKKMILTDDKVSVEGPKDNYGRLYMEGVGLSVGLLTNLMILEHKVVGHKPMSDKRTMKISSDRAEFSSRQQKASFKNNVEIRVEQMVVKGPLADFQYKNNKIDTLTMDGGIHMTDLDKMGTAGEAIVYFNENKCIFKKKPSFFQGESELIGEEVIVYDNGKRVQVKNAKAEYIQQGEAK